MEHETRFELAFPSPAPRAHTRRSLIARVSPFRWLPKSGRLQTKNQTQALDTKKARPASQDRLFLCMEHETRFELATLTLARETEPEEDQ